MTDPGDTSPLPPRDASPPVTQSPAHRPATDGSAPWLTGSAWAHPITDDSGELWRPARSRRRTWLRRAFFLIVLLIPLSVLLVGSAVYWQARMATLHEADAILVMGAAQYNGRPSEVYRARLEHALLMYERGYAPLVVLTGGKMPGDAYTEAESGAQYLIDRGVPASAIAWENQGRTTWESMQGVAPVLEGAGVESVLIVTDGFHLLRSELMARRLGFTAYGAAAPDSPIGPWSGAELSYVIRETGGIFAMLPELAGAG